MQIEIMETWKQILGYEGYYEISNIGRIRGVVTIRENQHKRNLNRTLPIGVQKVRGRYRAVIGIGGKNIHLGYFNTPEDASNAFNNKLKTIK
jgi:NUMOD4 motif